MSLRSVMGWTVSPQKIGHCPNSWCPWIWPYLTMEPLQILSNKMKSLGQSQFSLTNGLTGWGENWDTQRENTLWWQGQRLEWCSCEPRDTRSWQHCHKLWRSRKGFTQSLRVSLTLLIPGFQTSGPWKCERISVVLSCSVCEILLQQP